MIEPRPAHLHLVHSRSSVRHIKTYYYASHARVTKVHTNSSNTTTNAVPNCVKHMRSNVYQAMAAEVVDDATGRLLAVVTRSIRGKISIVYEVPYKFGE